jgi:hypothetical protein
MILIRFILGLCQLMNLWSYPCNYSIYWPYFNPWDFLKQVASSWKLPQNHINPPLVHNERHNTYPSGCSRKPMKIAIGYSSDHIIPKSMTMTMGILLGFPCVNTKKGFSLTKGMKDKGLVWDEIVGENKLHPSWKNYI